MLTETPVQPLPGARWFDPGLGLPGKLQWFEFGDLQVRLEDRIVIVEVETGGGLTNLVKYWPLSERPETPPMLLLHVFATGTRNNYVSHLRLWEFTWEKMKQDIWRCAEPRLFAQEFQFTEDDQSGLEQALDMFRDCLTKPLDQAKVQLCG